MYKVVLSAGDILNYYLNVHNGKRTSLKEIINNADLNAPFACYREGDLVPMITFRGSSTAEIAYRSKGKPGPAISVQFGGPACFTVAVRKYFTHVFPSDRLADHTNYTSIVSNELQVAQRQFAYSELVQSLADDKRDGWMVDVMSSQTERPGGSL